MKWEDYRGSDNVEDRRGGDDGGGADGGGGFRFPGGGGRGGGLGLGTIVVLGLVGWALGIDPRILIGGAEMISGGGPAIERQAPPPQRTTPGGQPTDELGRFASRILAQTEDTWKDIFAQAGRQYEQPRLVLFSGYTRSGCGAAQSAMGPFYCPSDHKVYLDLSFFQEMKTKFRAPGDFAAAYVVAHEVGHHVQNLIGILPKAHQAQAQSSKSEANAISVRVELQADCFAGVWAHHADKRFQILEQGDVEEAMAAATAIGDDRLQKQSQGFAVPDSFTHGSSAQRVRWFTTGLKGGSMKACDTFSASQL